MSPLEELGPPVDPEGLIRLDLPEPVVTDGVLHATLLYVDSFGNIALNLDRDDVEALGMTSGTRVELEISGERYYAVMARTFADARPGDVILYEDSYKNMSLAISRGSAARMLHASPGQEIRITIPSCRRRADAGPPTVAPPRSARRGSGGARRRPAGRSPGRRSEGRLRSSAAGATSPGAR